MPQVLIAFHLICFLGLGLFALFLYQYAQEKSELRTLVLGILIIFGLALTALFFPIEGFARVQLLAWVAFFYFSLFLILLIVYYWNENRRLSLTLAGLFLLTLGVAVDSFLIEPHWLQVTRKEIYVPKLEDTLTVAVLADIQTDSPGDYEMEVLEIVRDANPDLILFAGDYIQERTPEEYQQESEAFNEILQEAGLSPSLGIYAVRGNVDWANWSAIFEGLEVMTFEETETLDLGPVLLTGISWSDSRDPALLIPGGEKFHIVLGHYPDYSLGEIDGDLLLAGHTHGGQIQLPGIGPLLTNSRVPKSWASGLTEIQPDQFLMVSNGIGLERGYAPRIRFLCRPELILLTLLPKP